MFSRRDYYSPNITALTSSWDGWKQRDRGTVSLGPQPPLAIYLLSGSGPEILQAVPLLDPTTVDICEQNHRFLESKNLEINTQTLRIT